MPFCGCNGKVVGQHPRLNKKQCLVEIMRILIPGNHKFFFSVRICIYFHNLYYVPGAQSAVNGHKIEYYTWTSWNMPWKVFR